MANRKAGFDWVEKICLKCRKDFYSCDKYTNHLCGSCNGVNKKVKMPPPRSIVPYNDNIGSI